MSLVFGCAGTKSLTVKPAPPVKVVLSAVATSPRSKSPLVVVRFPLFGDVLVADAATTASREFASATPEYSRMAKRNGPETVMVTVMVLAPPTMFSA